ncbi:hypothetical protein AB88_2981 [Escherichia coli 2-222-05_S3_C1]|nr:hypothetical protein AC46_0167 [Escherichia coli 2-222-05_S3_C3]KEN89431.1 hypothetical protein AB88_2981 [Escherichia coli 2-222-05_S3_C1]
MMFCLKCDDLNFISLLMVVTPPEERKNLFFDEFYWRAFGTYRDRKTWYAVDPP